MIAEEEIDDFTEGVDDEPFIVTTALRKIKGMTKRKRVVQGGASSSKTFSIIPIMVDIAIRTPNREMSIVSESFPHLKKGAMKDFKKIMRKLNRWNDDQWNTTDSTYRFNNGSYIEFFSVKDESKVRGPRRHYLFINEANNVPFDAYHQLATRTAKVIWADHNPVAPYWAHTEVLTEDDAEMIVLTYEDNEAIPEGAKAELMIAKRKAEDGDPYWKRYWEVYGLGMLGSLEGAVYNNWNIIQKVPESAELLGFGLDFGFTNSKTAIVARYQHNGMKIWDEVCYESGLLNRDIYRSLKRYGCSSYSKIVADQAEPKSIHELKMMGLTVHPCKKGKDSVIHGIEIMQREPFYVTEGSLNMINELRNYVWLEEDGINGQKERTNTPIKANDHLMDAMRYLEQSLNKPVPKVRFRRDHWG